MMEDLQMEADIADSLSTLAGSRMTEEEWAEAAVREADERIEQEELEEEMATTYDRLSLPTPLDVFNAEVEMAEQEQDRSSDWAWAIDEQ